MNNKKIDMKKFYFCLVACFGFIGTAVNAQKVSVAPVDVVPGTTASFTLSLSEGKADTYKSLQFDVKFPVGFNTVATDKETNTDVWPGSSATVNTVDADGIVTVPISSSKAIANAEVEDLVTIQFSVASDVKLGTYQITLSKIAFGYGFTDKDYADDVTFDVNVVNALSVTLSENATEAPKAATGVNVKVERTIAADTWSTIVLPFDMTEAQVKEAFGDGVVIGDLKAWTSETEGKDVTAIVVQFESVSAIEANHPYVIKTSKEVTEFTVEGVDIAPEDEPYVEVGKRATLGSMTGTYVAGAKVPAESLFLSGGKFWYSKGSSKPMKAFRAYFEFFDILAAYDEASARINITFDDVTAIKGIKTTDGEEIYTLSGQRVDKAGKGVYIVNGKKVIKK